MSTWILVIPLGVASLAVAGAIWELRRLLLASKSSELEAKRRVYELAILKELGERVGYSLDIERIVDVITGSLHQLIDYSAVSYMLLEQDKILFKVHLEESVSHGFVTDVRKRMLKSLSALLDREVSDDDVDQTVMGAIVVDEVDDPVRSFFNIPLVIGDKVVGVLTVADTRAGLYKEEEMTILYKITNQASQAVTRLQDVLYREQRKLNAMVESMVEGVVMTDTDYRIVVVNPAAKRAVGIENIEEPTVFDFIDHLEGKFDIRGRLEESVKLDRELISEDLLMGEKYYQIAVSPVKSSHSKIGDAEILGGVVIFHDVTHEREVAKLREEFTSMMAHELRSPLTSIQKMTEFLENQHRAGKPASLEKYVGMINMSATEMLSIVNDMLDMAKMEAGKFVLAKEDASIRDIVQDRIDFYGAQAASKNLQLVQRVDEAVPDIISLDPMRVRQAINNLFSNAMKFTEPGGAIALDVLHHVEGQDLVTEVGALGWHWYLNEIPDHGRRMPNSIVVAVSHPEQGIPEEQIGKLFNVFGQLEGGQKLSAPGTGLGLVILKGVVEAHGGLVGVGSQAGKGVTFYFTLPV